MQALEQDLRDAIAGEVRFDDMSRGLYSTDASIYQIKPLGVVFPKSRDDVRAAVRICARHGAAILPRGGGTSLSGQTVARAVVLDFSRHMNRILELDPERQLVRIEPGVVLEQLNAALRPHNLQFGPDVSTSSRANLGGMIGNNSAGSHSILQGKTIDHVRELCVVLADGTELTCGPLSPTALAQKQSQEDYEGRIYREFPALVAAHRREIMARYPRLVRRVSGYNLDCFVHEFVDKLPRPPASVELDRLWPDRREFNLARLFVGAEGTLGVVTEAVIHAVPRAKERGVVCLLFESLAASTRAVGKILECQPSAVEMLDKYIVELSRENLQYKHYLDFIQGAPASLLIVEFSAERPAQIDDACALLTQKMRGQPGLVQMIRAETAEQREQIWRCREAGAPLLLSIPGARKPIAFIEDTAVDPSKLPEFIARFHEILEKHGVNGAYYGHASVGCLHIRPMLDTKSAEDLAKLKAVSDEIVKLVIEFRGSMSGEHGDGLARSYHNRALFGEELFRAFGEVKRLFDPQGLMNPEKVVGSPSPIDDLRYGTQYQGEPVHTFQDFSREAALAEAPGLGFLAAAEMCNGSGVCRKTHTGTMCPSFMVTLDEEHSTRGRANALRLALSGQLPSGSLTSQRMHDVMDLCLMCKGCKAECPSNVDVAKLKVEFLAHYHQAHPPGLGEIAMANVAWINRIGSAFAPLSNWIAGMPIMRSLSESISGVDHRRSLPRFERQNFPKWFRRHQPAIDAGQRGTVVLLDDCLTSYCEPNINRSAVTLLERAGYKVKLAGLWCCGRPFISKGFVERGKQLARRNIARLARYVDRGWPILGCEPSCLLTLVDEYPDLFPSDETDRVRRNAFLVDAWLAEQKKIGPLNLTFSPLAQTALVHGHCQQKALIGMKPLQNALGMIPELQVRPVDSGCCGMAGSFGYDHFDVSQQIGRRVLFPAVEKHTEGPVIAPGFSCRHQIADGTGKHALHPVELLARQLTEPRTQ